MKFVFQSSNPSSASRVRSLTSQFRMNRWVKPQVVKIENRSDEWRPPGLPNHNHTETATKGASKEVDARACALVGLIALEQ